MRHTLPTFAAVWLLLAGCATQGEEADSARIVRHIQADTFHYARNLIGNMSPGPGRDSLMRMMQRERTAFMRDSLPVIYSRFESIMARDEIEVLTTSFAGYTGQVIQGKAGPDLMLRLGIGDKEDIVHRVLDHVIETRAEDADALQISCGDWSQSNQDGMWIERRVMERIASGNCSIWVQPYGQKRSVRPEEAAAARSLLDAKQEFDRLLYADAIDPDTVNFGLLD